MLSIALAGYLESTVLYRFHATFAGITLGPVDTIFTATSILAIFGGLYAVVSLRGIHLVGERGADAEANGASIEATARIEHAPAML